MSHCTSFVNVNGVSFNVISEDDSVRIIVGDRVFTLPEYSFGQQVLLLEYQKKVGVIVEATYLLSQTRWVYIVRVLEENKNVLADAYTMWPL